MNDDGGVAGPASRSFLLHAERLHVRKRLRKTLVRVVRTTMERFVAIDEALARERVVVTHVPIGREVDTVPPVREEDGVTIMSVVEEQLVLVRRLVLTEEVHIRRIRTMEQHVETVALRREVATVTRIDINDSLASAQAEPTPEETIMSDETIVAIYDTAAHAELAASDLRQAGVPDSAIDIHAGAISSDRTGTTASVPREQGFWANLFGGSPDHDTSVYERSINDGASVLTVRTPEKHVAHVMKIVESHKPIDIDERAASYGSTDTVTGSAPATLASYSTAAPMSPKPDATRSNDGMIQLSEESLSVGKRVVNRGGTRIRRFVVERPVEESVNLHSETVVLDRHPVTDGRPTTDSFSEKSIEMMETAEEAVVSKTAHVYEEVGLHREASDRTETVKDTVRREEVEVEKIPGSTTTVKDGPAVTRSTNS